MKTALRPFHAFKTILPGGLAFALLFSGTACSECRELSLDLGDGVKLEVVKTPDGIWWGKSEVTQEQWQTVTRHGNPVLYERQTAPDKPVVQVAPEDVEEFLHKLNALPAVKKHGLVFRLPDRSEWELACLAGSPGPWPLMKDGTQGTLERLAWFDGDWHESHAVCLKEPNAYGLYDMLGNVSERTTTDGVDSFGNPGKWYGGGDLSFEAEDYVDQARSGMCKDTKSCPFNGFRICAPAKGYAAPPKAPPTRDPPAPGWNGEEDEESNAGKPSPGTDRERDELTFPPPERTLPEPEGFREPPIPALLPPPVSRPESAPQTNSGPEASPAEGMPGDFMEMAKRQAAEKAAHGDWEGAQKVLESARAISEAFDGGAMVPAAESEEAQRRAEEAERRAREAEEALKKAEAKAAELQRVLEERLAKLEQQAERPVPAAQASGADAPPPAAEIRAGEAMTVTLPGGATMQMVWCPPGSFTMGDDNSGQNEEKPAHRVTLTSGFWMAETEVTQKQWTSVMGNNPSFCKNGADHPVEMVAWEEAAEFCGRCTRAGVALQLPTEAQWEYACRAGTTGAYGGTGRLPDMGWYGERVTLGSHPVKGKRPNAWGLYDMHGNVWEWCSDWGTGRYSSTGSETDPRGPDNGAVHMQRGGGWCDDAEKCRSASRRGMVPNSRYVETGFRPVMVPSCEPNGGGRVGMDFGNGVVAWKVASPADEYLLSLLTGAPVSGRESVPPPAKSGGEAGGVDTLRRGTSAGEVRTIRLPGGSEMRFAWCPTGTFSMGSPPSEDGREPDEAQHQVTLTRGFWMAVTEVTQEQWTSVMGENPSKYRDGGDFPVENVSWADCWKFCQKAGLALPTEAEWEYACRAGTTTPFGGAGDMGREGVYGVATKPQPVARQRANAWGLHDMHGNVWEWCADWYGKYSKRAAVDPTGPATGTERVIRGGAFGFSWRYCRSAYRNKGKPEAYSGASGFRPVFRPD